MPYIKPELRPSCIRAADAVIDECRFNNWNAGVLNYILSRIVWQWFRESHNYATVNSIGGVLRCVWDEFYRRHAGPYDDEKKELNGDVYKDELD